MQNENPSWHRVANVDEVASPALLVYPERVEQNIDLLLRVSGGAPRLRPHVKTHKLGEVIRQNVRAKWEGHEINTARFIKPLRTMHAIGG